jgi:subtilisin-like proprotein convertase family protein
VIGLTCGGTPPPPGPYFENLTDISIPDSPGPAVDSPITVTGVSGNAPSDLQVGVDIKHTYRGDLVIDLVAPDGSLYRLKNSNASDSADNVITTYPVNASTEVANGTWRLRVRDVYSADVGFIDKFSLTF